MLRKKKRGGEGGLFDAEKEDGDEDVDGHDQARAKVKVKAAKKQT